MAKKCGSEDREDWWKSRYNTLNRKWTKRFTGAAKAKSDAARGGVPKGLMKQHADMAKKVEHACYSHLKQVKIRANTCVKEYKALQRAGGQSGTSLAKCQQKRQKDQMRITLLESKCNDAGGDGGMGGMGAGLGKMGMGMGMGMGGGMGRGAGMGRLGGMLGSGIMNLGMGGGLGQEMANVNDGDNFEDEDLDNIDDDDFTAQMGLSALSPSRKKKKNDFSGLPKMPKSFGSRR